MTNNTTLNPGSGGDVIANEDIGGVKYPVAKIYTGAAGSSGGPVTASNPLPVAARTNAARSVAGLHRSAITAADKLANPAAPTGTGAVVSGASLSPGASYGICTIARNAYGTTLASGVLAMSPGGGNNAIRIAVAQVAGATNYELFITAGNSVSMLWVASIAEAQRAAGGIYVNAVGTASSGGASPAGQVDLGIVGSGLANTAASYSANTAYAWSGVTPVNCAGYSRAAIYASLALADTRAAPLLAVVPMLQNQTDSNYYPAVPIAAPIGTAPGASYRQVASIDVDGAANLLVLIDSIGGQGAAATVWVELS